MHPAELPICPTLGPLWSGSSLEWASDVALISLVTHCHNDVIPVGVCHGLADGHYSDCGCPPPQMVHLLFTHMRLFRNKQPKPTQEQREQIQNGLGLTAANRENCNLISANDRTLNVLGNNKAAEISLEKKWRR